MNDDRWRYFLQISTDIVKYARKILCPLRNYSLSKSCSKSYFSLQKSLTIALVNWGRPFFLWYWIKNQPSIGPFPRFKFTFFDLFFETKGLFWSYFVNLLRTSISRETASNTSFQDKYWLGIKKKCYLKIKRVYKFGGILKPHLPPMLNKFW